MKLTSPDFAPGGLIPARFTCDGEGINPELNIQDVPLYAVSLVLLMEDPDVPPNVRKDQMWDHWVVFNIPPRTSRIPHNTQPAGIIGRNTSGEPAYQGPCPPDRRHRYFFKLYALDTLLPLSTGATKTEVVRALQGHILASDELIGLYERQKEGG
jgi:hypothetical protein